MPTFPRCNPYLGRVLLLHAILLTGCEPPQKLAPFSGKVIYKNQPLKFGGVMFQPEAGQPARATIMSDGTFTLSTFREGDGATIGKNQVRVTCFPSQQPAGEASASQGELATGGSFIPPKYNDFSTSGLVVEVQATKNDGVIIELTD